MIQTAGHIDALMPHRMSIKITSALNRHKKAVNGSRIMFLVVAYKPNFSDERESPDLKIMDEVVKKGGLVSYYDPHAKTPNGIEFDCVSYDDIVSADLVIISTKHSAFDTNDIKS